MIKIIALAIAALAWTACSPAGKGMSEAELPTLAGSQGARLSSCPTPKCLTVYVAPWCGYCRASTPQIIALREFLKANNVATRIVVGQDRLSSVRDYAREFGPDTLLDPDNAVAVSGGVPHFYVSDSSGALLKDVPGIPQTDDIRLMASYFGLP